MRELWGIAHDTRKVHKRECSLLFRSGGHITSRQEIIPKGKKTIVAGPAYELQVCFSEK